MKTLVRIMFVLILGLGLVATTDKTATSASSDKIQLKLVTYSMSEKKPMYAIREFASRVKERSGGRLEINILGGPEIFAPPDLLSKVKAGLADMAFCPAGYWVAVAPELAYDGLPFDVTWDGLSALMDAVKPMVDTVYDRHGVKSLGDYYVPGPFHLLTKAPIHSRADLKGKSIRGHGVMPGILIESLGASAVVMPSAELVGALERGVVGGAMVTLPTSQDLKIWDLGVKYCVDYELAFAFACNAIINGKAYNRLPPDLQKTLVDVGSEVEKFMVRHWKEDEANVAADLKARGIIFYTPPPDQAKRWREASVEKAGPAFLGIKGVDKGIAQQFVDLMKKEWR